MTPGSEDSHAPVAAIVLAAGASTRLGQPKQLVTLAGETLLARAVHVAQAAHCSPILLVLGANAEAISAACPLPSVQIVRNQGWAEGLASSIRAGIAALPATSQAAILMTCDQPAVTPGHLRRLIALAADQPVASSYSGRHGVPACMPASSFAALLQLRGDSGARALLQSAQAIPLPGGEIDIDTPASLAKARQHYGQREP